MLEVQRLQAGYGASPVLFGIDLRLQAGEAATLLGRNGMGKSTLLRTLSGAIQPTAGSIRIDGVDVSGWSADRIARLGVALVPEGRQIFPNLTVREHLLAFASTRHGNQWQLDSLFALFPRLAERAANFGTALSGGEQQMLAIARALSTNPRLLILDEATEGLAPLVREDIWACVARLRASGQTLLIVDKYVRRLMNVASQHHILERGRVAWQGDSAALAADPELWQRHLGV